METYSLQNKPEGMTRFRKKSTAEAVFLSEPFVVETQEGAITVSPETVDDWQDGYWLVYPDDGSKPYTWSPKFKEGNMVEIEDGVSARAGS